jgi:hypothetical protein
VTGPVACACGRPVPDQAYACPHCADRLATELGEVAGLGDALDDTYSRQGRFSSAIGVLAHSPVQPLPWDERASTCARTLRNTLSTWCRVVTGERGTDPPADTLAAMAGHLAANLEWLRHHPAAAECVDELCRAVAAARYAVDRPRERLYAGPCWRDVDGGECPGELYAVLGAAEVACPVCGWLFEVAERRAWLLEAARDVLATATLVSAALSRLDLAVTPERLWKWRERGRIFNHSAPGDDPTYRVGDVIDLLDAYAAQQAQREARKAG